MQPPAFWFRDRHAPGLLPHLLAPLARLWTVMTRRRLAKGPYERLAVPVICVGNLSLGGAGKTPTVMALITELTSRGMAPHVISRGHGGRLTGPVRVDETRHTAGDVGDEPLLLAPFAPVWVARDRAAAGRAAAEAGADVIVMDDGFQNPALVRDLSIVVVDAGVGFGNGRVAPAGPLREPVPEGLARADLVMAIGAPEERARFRETWPEAAALPFVEAELAPLQTGMDWEGLRAFAFAGIGRPEKFFRTLRALGAEIAGTRAFDDHGVYDGRILSRLEANARTAGAQLVTTEKDAARLPQDFRRNVIVLPVRLNMINRDGLDAQLDRLWTERSVEAGKCQ